MSINTPALVRYKWHERPNAEALASKAGKTVVECRQETRYGILVRIEKARLYILLATDPGAGIRKLPIRELAYMEELDAPTLHKAKQRIRKECRRLKLKLPGSVREALR